MTTLPQPYNLPMDFPTLDEKMDMASSPFHQVEVEDLDLEFDQMENQNLMLPSDNPMDDASELGSKTDDATQGDDVELLEDADMHDNGHEEVAQVEKDLDMGEEALANQDQEDEILYDDEEEEEDDTAVADGAAEQQTNLPEPTNPEEDLFDFDDTDHIDISTRDQQPQKAVTPLETTGELNTTQQQNEGQPEGGNSSLHETLQSRKEQHSSSETTQQAQDAATDTQETSEQREEEESELFDDHTNEQQAHETNTQEHSEHPEGTKVSQQEAQAEPETASPIDISSLAPHFVMLKFNEVEYPLFSDEEAASDQLFPLSDTSLIFEPLDKLLDACRERVFNPDVDHVDEVVFSIPSFALHYCQDSKYTSQRTLADILQVYVMLKQNEQADSIQPLSCELTIRTCLATQYNWLVEEASKQTPYKYFHTEYVTNNVLPSGDNVQPLEENVEVGVTTHGEEASFEQYDVEAEQEAEAAGNGSGEAFEHAYDQAEETDVQADELQTTSTTNVGDSALGEPGTTDAEPTGEQGDEAGQPSEFFEDAFENEDDADEAENEEEALEQEEDQRALEHTQQDLDASGGLGDPEQIEEQEQIDFGDEPEPFKQVEEEKQIADEEEDLFIDPDDPLEADEDPDALLEGRAADIPPESEASNPNSVSESTNGNHITNGSTLLPQPATPAKSRPSKRKVEDDEDDLLDLDLDTPEPKRRRPSPP